MSNFDAVDHEARICRTGESKTDAPPIEFCSLSPLAARNSLFSSRAGCHLDLHQGIGFNDVEAHRQKLLQQPDGGKGVG